MLAFPPFRPDAGEMLSGVADNVLYLPDGYGPRKKLSAAPDAGALPDPPRGTLGAVLPDGTFKAFAATADDIYEMDATYAWDSLGATLAVPDGEDMSMTTFGAQLIASNSADGMFAYDMASPAGVNAIGGAPAARVIFTTNNVLVALGDANNLQRLATTAFGDHTNWRTKGASRQDMIDGEAFTGGADLANGQAVILQANAVRRMTFGNVGGGAIFRLDKIAEGVGAVHPRSVIAYNRMVAFLHTSGFKLTDGTSVIPIGAQKMDAYFLNELCAPGTLEQVYGAVDPVRTMFWWRFKSVSDDSDTVFTRLVGFDWVRKEWVTATESTSAIFRMATPGYTLEDLDVFGTLDDLPYSLDSRFWAGGQPNLAGLDADLKFGFFDGVNAQARLETATQASPASVLVNSVTPVTDDPGVLVRLGVKDRQADAISWKPSATTSASGRAHTRGRGKMQRVRHTHTEGADWSIDKGVDAIEASAGGPR